MLLLAVCNPAFAPIPIPEPNQACAMCDWEHENYVLVGAEMRCVSREPPAQELVWYNLDQGTCSVVSATAEELVFNMTVSAGIEFTNAPYKHVLLPSEVAELSNMSHYEGKAVAVSLHIGARARPLIYVGNLTVRPDGMAVLHGERVGEHTTAIVAMLLGTVSCMLNEVRDMVQSSAVGHGTCHFSGEGVVDIGIDAVRMFSQAGIVAPGTADLGVFTGLNAGTYDESGDAEVLTITQATTTHLTGTAYFSSRLGTWATDVGRGVPHRERCSFFVDSVVPPPKKLPVGLAFSGGGFRAMAHCMMVARGLAMHTDAQGKLLYDMFSHVSANSGGTWCTTQLGYSYELWRDVTDLQLDIEDVMNDWATKYRQWTDFDVNTLFDRRRRGLESEKAAGETMQSAQKRGGGGQSGEPLNVSATSRGDDRRELVDFGLCSETIKWFLDAAFAYILPLGGFGFATNEWTGYVEAMLEPFVKDGVLTDAPADDYKLSRKGWLHPTLVYMLALPPDTFLQLDSCEFAGHDWCGQFRRSKLRVKDDHQVLSVTTTVKWACQVQDFVSGVFSEQHAMWTPLPDSCFTLPIAGLLLCGAADGCTWEPAEVWLSDDCTCWTCWIDGCSCDYDYWTGLVCQKAHGTFVVGTNPLEGTCRGTYVGVGALGTCEQTATGTGVTTLSGVAAMTSELLSRGAVLPEAFSVPGAAGGVNERSKYLGVYKDPSFKGPLQVDSYIPDWLTGVDTLQEGETFDYAENNPSLLSLTAGSSAALGFLSSPRMISDVINHYTVAGATAIDAVTGNLLRDCLPGGLEKLAPPFFFESRDPRTIRIGPPAAAGKWDASPLPPNYRHIDGGFVDNSAGAFLISKLQDDCEAGFLDCPDKTLYAVVADASEPNDCTVCLLFANDAIVGDGVEPGKFTRGPQGGFLGVGASNPQIFAESFPGGNPRVEPGILSGYPEGWAAPEGWTVYAEPASWDANAPAAMEWEGTVTTVENQMYRVREGWTVKLKVLKGNWIAPTITDWIPGWNHVGLDDTVAEFKTTYSPAAKQHALPVGNLVQDWASRHGLWETTASPTSTT